MASGSFRLNACFFDENKLKEKGTNPHRLSLNERVSRPTILKYLRNEDVRNFSGDVLYAILVNGFGLSPDEIEDLRIGDVFELIGTNGASQ